MDKRDDRGIKKLAMTTNTRDLSGQNKLSEDVVDVIEGCSDGVPITPPFLSLIDHWYLFYYV